MAREGYIDGCASLGCGAPTCRFRKTVSLVTGRAPSDLIPQGDVLNMHRHITDLLKAPQFFLLVVGLALVLTAPMLAQQRADHKSDPGSYCCNCDRSKRRHRSRRHRGFAGPRIQRPLYHHWRMRVASSNSAMSGQELLIVSRSMPTDLQTGPRPPLCSSQASTKS